MNGIILCGGKSTRMGTDKGLMLFEGKPMILHIIEKLQKLTNKIFLITENADYEQFGLPCVPDVIRDSGPMSGILSGLLASDSQKNLVLSCDIPSISIEALEMLIINAGDEDVLAVKQQGRVEPLCAIYDKNCIPFFNESITKKELKMITSLEKINTKYLIINDIEKNIFKNYNTPSDFLM